MLIDQSDELMERLARFLCENGDIDETYDYGDFAGLTTAREYAAQIVRFLAREEPEPPC